MSFVSPYDMNVSSKLQIFYIRDEIIVKENIRTYVKVIMPGDIPGGDKGSLYRYWLWTKTMKVIKYGSRCQNWGTKKPIYAG